MSRDFAWHQGVNGIWYRTAMFCGRDSCASPYGKEFGLSMDEIRGKYRVFICLACDKRTILRDALTTQRVAAMHEASRAEEARADFDWLRIGWVAAIDGMPGVEVVVSGYHRYPDEARTPTGVALVRIEAITGAGVNCKIGDTWNVVAKALRLL